MIEPASNNRPRLPPHSAFYTKSLPVPAAPHHADHMVSMRHMALQKNSVLASKNPSGLLAQSLQLTFPILALR